MKIRLLSTILCAVLVAVSFVACSDDDDARPELVISSPSTVTLKVGSTSQIEYGEEAAQYYDNHGGRPNVASDNEFVATCNVWEIRGEHVGETTIRIQDGDAEIQVKVIVCPSCALPFEPYCLTGAIPFGSTLDVAQKVLGEKWDKEDSWKQTRWVEDPEGENEVEKVELYNTYYWVKGDSLCVVMKYKNGLLDGQCYRVADYQKLEAAVKERYALDERAKIDELDMHYIAYDANGEERTFNMWYFFTVLFNEDDHNYSWQYSFKDLGF